jgi:hypothetical protein
MDRECRTHGQNSNGYIISVGKLEGNRQVRHTWEDNIKMHLGGIGWGGVDWIHLAEDGDEWRTLENTTMKLRVP